MNKFLKKIFLVLITAATLISGIGSVFASDGEEDYDELWPCKRSRTIATARSAFVIPVSTYIENDENGYPIVVYNGISKSADLLEKRYKSNNNLVSQSCFLIYLFMKETGNKSLILGVPPRKKISTIGNLISIYFARIYNGEKTLLIDIEKDLENIKRSAEKSKIFSSNIIDYLSKNHDTEFIFSRKAKNLLDEGKLCFKKILKVTLKDGTIYESKNIHNIGLAVYHVIYKKICSHKNAFKISFDEISEFIAQ